MDRERTSPRDEVSEDRSRRTHPRDAALGDISEGRALESRCQKTASKGRVFDFMREQKLREAGAIDINCQKECLVTARLMTWRRFQTIPCEF